MALQTKLEFNVRPEQLARLRSLPLFRKISKGRAKTRALSTVYFDTRHGDLRRLGVSLRVRRDNGNYLQTLKATAEAVGNARVGYAFEAKVSTARPALSLISPPSLRQRIQEVGAERLQPRFRIDVNRTDRTIAVGDDAEAVLEVEEGVIHAGDKSIAVADVEFSTTNAPLHRLYELALSVQEKVALYPVAESESDIAYRHMGLVPARGGESPVSPVRKRRKLEKVFSVVLHDCFEKLQETATRIHEGSEMRSASEDLATLRRLKSALQAFHHMLPAEAGARMLNEVDDFIAVIQAWKDWQEFDGRLLRPIRRRLGDAVLLEPAIGVAEARSQVARDAVYQALSAEQFRGVLLTLGYWLAVRPWQQVSAFPKGAAPGDPITPFARRVLSRKSAEIRKLAKHSPIDDVANRRALADAIVELGTIVNLFGSLFPVKKVETMVAQIKRIETRQRYLDALDNAWSELASLGGSGNGEKARTALSAGIVLGWHARSRETAERKLKQHMESFLSEKPPWSRDVN